MSPPRTPRQRISASLARNRAAAKDSTFIRKTYVQPRDTARQIAQKWFNDYPKAAYWTEVESWRIVEGDVVEFTMRRLPSAD